MIDNEITMDLSAVVAAMLPRLREMIGANVALQLNLECEGLWVKTDAGRIEQVVVHLITNALDAMPEGGTITVETSRVDVGPDFIRRKVSESKDFKSLRLDMDSAPSEGNYARLLVRTPESAWTQPPSYGSLIHFLPPRPWGRARGLASPLCTQS
jgi:signal transduction histidine kinase